MLYQSVLVLMVTCHLLPRANGYKIAYLTQEPEFDDSKTVLDTVLSSDLVR